MKDKDGDNPLWGIAGVIIILILAFTVVPKLFNQVTGAVSGNSNAKKYCGKHHTVLNAKTNTAAKLAYKSCMKSY